MAPFCFQKKLCQQYLVCMLYSESLEGEGHRCRSPTGTASVHWLPLYDVGGLRVAGVRTIHVIVYLANLHEA